MLLLETMVVQWFSNFKVCARFITDTTRIPGVGNKKRITGTMAHVGGFSLYYHKHKHAGKSGIFVIKDGEIYK